MFARKSSGALMLGLVLLLPAGALFGATPDPTSAILTTRVFNDCPISGLLAVNNYPASITIDDTMRVDCLGYANLHVWSFSVNGTDPVDFSNDSHFSFCADVTVGGSGVGEGGLRLSPWWALDTDGRFMLNTNTGEIAVFGGRLPFYSFTVNNSLTYVKGTTVHLEMIYVPNGLSSVSPATIEYKLTMGGNLYTSGALPFDEGNPAEDPPHGLWGILTPARVGGYVQPYAALSAGGVVTAEWANICYTNLAVNVENTSWGRLKDLYR